MQKNYTGQTAKNNIHRYVITELPVKCILKYGDSLYCYFIFLLFLYIEALPNDDILPGGKHSTIQKQQ